LLASSIPLGVITILLFWAPNLSVSNRIIYAYITYLTYGFLYALSDIPYWGLASTMTPNPEERTSFISIARSFHFIGNGLPVALVPIFGFLAIALGKDEFLQGYLYAGIFVGVVGASLFLLSVTGTKERCILDIEKPTLKENIDFFLKNKPLQVVFCANIAGFGQTISIMCGLYIATYIMGNSNLNVFVVAATGVSGYIGMLLTPKLLKKFDYRQLYQICAIVAIIAFSSMLLFGINFVSQGGILITMIILGFLFVSGFSSGIIGNINFGMMADSIDYIEWKTGKRTEGIAMSVQSLMIKLIGSLQVVFFAFMLIVIKFVQPEIIDGIRVQQQQMDSTLKGMFLILTLTPMICWALGALIMSRYKFVGDMRKQAQADLEALRKEVGRFID